MLRYSNKYYTNNIMLAFEMLFYSLLFMNIAALAIYIKIMHNI